MTTNCYDINYYMGNKIVYIDRKIYARTPRTALKYSSKFLHWDFKGEFDTVKIFLVENE